MPRPRLRRTIVVGIVVLLTLPAVLAADHLQRSSGGATVVFHEAPRAGAVYRYDLSFTSALHDLNIAVEDLLVIEVHGTESVAFPDGSQHQALKISARTKLTLLDELSTPCFGCSSGDWRHDATQGYMHDTWWLRLSDGLVIQRVLDTSRIDSTQTSDEHQTRYRNETIWMPDGNTFPSIVGSRDPHQPFTYGTDMMRVMVASVAARQGSPIDLNSILDGSDATIDARGTLDGEPVYRVRHRAWDAPGSASFSCGVPFPDIGYADHRNNDQFEGRSLHSQGTSALWLAEGKTFPAYATCHNRYQDKDTADLVEEIDLRIRLRQHEAGGAPVGLGWTDSYYVANARFDRPPALAVSTVRIPGAPMDGEHDLRLHLDDALRVAQTDHALQSFRDDADPPFHVRSGAYRPTEYVPDCQNVVPVPDPLGVPIIPEAPDCGYDRVAWHLTLVNRRNQTISALVEARLDDRGRPGTARIAETEGPESLDAEDRNPFGAYSTELVPLDAAIADWTERGLLPPDWQDDRRYGLGFGRVFWTSLGLSFTDRPEPGTSASWRDSLFAETGERGWYQVSSEEHTPTPLSPMRVQDADVAARVAVEPHVPVAAGVTLGALLMGVLAYLLWPLLQKTPLVTAYAKLRRGRLLDHPVRIELHSFLEANGSANTSEIRHALGLAQGTATHHLLKLKEHGLVRDETVAGNRIWSLADAQAPDALDILLQRPAVARVWACVRERPGSTQRELATAIGVAKTSIQAHTRRLAEAGALDVKRDGRTVRHWPRPANA